MSNLFVVAYDDLATAQQVRDKLLSMNREHLVELDDIVVVERRAKDGKVKLHQTVNHAATGAVGGALWGSVIGLLFLVPLLGAAVGAAAGAAGGAATDTGVNDDFMRELSENLRPGAAAVFVLVKQAARDKVVPELAQFGGQLVQTSLSHDEENQLIDMAKAARAGAAASAAAAAAE